MIKLFNLGLIALFLCSGVANAQTKSKNNNASYFVAQAEKNMSDRNYSLAYENFTKAIALKKIPKYYCQRAACLLVQKKYNECLIDSDKAIALDTKYSKAYFIKATALQFTNNITEAIQFYSKAIEYSPNYTDAYLMRGLLYATLKKKSEACSDLHKAIELGSTDTEKHLKDICG